MNLVKISVLIIFSCLCLTEIYSMEYGFSQFEESSITVPKKESHCFLPMYNYFSEKMPVPFSKKNAEFFTLLYPNMNDMLVIEKGEAIGFLCAKTRFIHLNLEHLSELEVRCVGNNKLEFKGLQYYYEQFECKSMPESEVINTDKKCQFDLYSYNIVGFRTETAVIPIYAFCFDSLKMQTAISWHFPLDPTTSMFQEYSTERHPFIKSDDMYNFMDMDAIYAVENQTHVITDILKTKEPAKKYINPEENRYLTKGQLTNYEGFYYDFEKVASFYYVNTAPMWKRNIEQWTHVEEAIRGTVKSTDHKFVIISGTFGSDMLPDVNNTQQPLFLSKTKQVPVPSIFWKLLFDINLMTVKVYLVSNDPNMNPERLSYICENRCQEERDYLNEIAPELFPNKLYCCDIHSFQKVYGILEPLVIIENVMNRLTNEERSFENYSSEESDWTDEIE